MKITFEGETLDDIFNQMENALDCSVGKHKDPGPKVVVPEVVVPEVIAPKVMAPVDKPVNKPVQKRERTEKQKANDERLRVAAQAKLEAKRAAKAAKNAPPSYPEPPPPASAESLGLAPDEVVRVRQKTIEDLQSAYANGFQKEVFELLSRFGNGAKSFRELPPESFVPIREAIDLGALTDKAPT